MYSSILDSVKDAAGVNVEDDSFDAEIIMHINAVFMILRQIGVGPTTPFQIEDNTSEWTDFTTDENLLPMVRSYVTLQVRKLFDPPVSSALSSALHDTITEYEWRLNIEADKYRVEEDERYARYFRSNS